VGAGRDGLIYKQTLASYLHIHALGTPEWADGLMTAANNYKLRI
jgi:cobyrinic acid a,c-diamide synthase